MTAIPLDDITRKLDRALVEEPARGFTAPLARLHRSRTFDLEMKHSSRELEYLATRTAGGKRRLPDDLDRPQPVIVSRTRTGDLAAVVNASAHAARWSPPQEGQQVHLDLPVPRLDLQQRREAAEGQGRQGRRLPGAVQHRRLPRYDEGASLRVLPRVPVRQPQPGRAGCPSTSARPPSSST